MAKTIKVGASYGETVQPAKFESIRTDFWAEVELEEGDNPAEVRAVLKRVLKKEVKAAIKADIAEW